MTNYEKYKEWFDNHLLDFVIGEETLAIDACTNKPMFCSDMATCDQCQLNGACAADERMAWLRAEDSDVDWSKIAVDTKIQVKFSEEDAWENRYFAKYENGTVYSFLAGLTSFTAPKLGRYTAWPIARLYKED